MRLIEGYRNRRRARASASATRIWRLPTTATPSPLDRGRHGSVDHAVLDPWTTETVTQSGSPGDTVDNGLYIARGFRGLDGVDGLDTCSDGNYRITLAWYSRARDFGGNEAYYGTARISYLHFGS